MTHYKWVSVDAGQLPAHHDPISIPRQDVRFRSAGWPRTLQERGERWLLRSSCNLAYPYLPRTFG